MRLWRAQLPSAVLKTPSSQSGLSFACVVGESATQASTSGMRRKASRKGERLIDFLTGRVVVLRLNIFLFIAVIFLFPVVNAAIAGLKEKKPPSGRSAFCPIQI